MTNGPKNGVYTLEPTKVDDNLAERANRDADDQRTEALSRANKVRRAILDQEMATEVELQVRDLEHARSEEVMRFALKELSSGTTYNALRLKLGLGNSAVDPRWRSIRAALGELILPESEEEALKQSHAMSGYMIEKIEKFQRKIEERALAMQGEDSEAAFLKLELEAMKLIMEKYDKHTEHFLKMKQVQRQEKGTTGKTIVFNNKFYIPRPGEVPKDVSPLSDAAQLIGKLQELEDEV